MLRKSEKEMNTPESVCDLIFDEFLGKHINVIWRDNLSSFKIEEIVADEKIMFGTWYGLNYFGTGVSILFVCNLCKQVSFITEDADIAKTYLNYFNGHLRPINRHRQEWFNDHRHYVVKYSIVDLYLHTINFSIVPDEEMESIKQEAECTFGRIVGPS